MLQIFQQYPTGFETCGECLPYSFLLLETVKGLNVHICSIQYAHPSSSSITESRWAEQVRNSPKPMLGMEFGLFTAESANLAQSPPFPRRGMTNRVFSYPPFIHRFRR